MFVNDTLVAQWGGGTRAQGANELSDIGRTAGSRPGRLVLNGRLFEPFCGGDWERAKQELIAFLTETNPAVIAEQRCVPPMLARMLTDVRVVA